MLCSVLFFRLSSNDDFGKPRLGLVGPRQEGLGLVLSTSDSVLVHAFETESRAQDALEEGEVDGFVVLAPDLAHQISTDAFPSIALHVVESESLRTRLMERAIENGARTVAGQEIPVDLQVQGLIRRKGDVSWAEGLLPSWLVFTAMSGLMFCSASIIEEKDHGTLLGS